MFTKATALLVIFLFLTGCNSSLLKKESVETNVAEVFGKEKEANSNFDYYEAQIDTFLARTVLIKDGLTTYEGLKILGLDPGAKNVNESRGAKVLPYLLGTENPQIQVNNATELNSFLDKYGNYIVLKYPLHNFKKTLGVAYFNDKLTETVGTDLDFIIVLEKEIVVKHYFSGSKKIDRKVVESSAGEGIVSTLKDAKEILEIVLFYYILRDAMSR